MREKFSLREEEDSDSLWVFPDDRIYPREYENFVFNGNFKREPVFCGGKPSWETLSVIPCEPFTQPFRKIPEP